MRLCKTFIADVRKLISVLTSLLYSSRGDSRSVLSQHHYPCTLRAYTRASRFKEGAAHVSTRPSRFKKRAIPGEWGGGQPSGCAILWRKCQVTTSLSTFELLVFARYCCSLTSQRRRCLMRFRLISFCSPKCFRRQLLKHPQHVPRHVA